MEIRYISTFFGGNPEGRDTWITWYAKLLPNWDHGTAASWCLITQILGQTGTYYPAFAINLVGPSPGQMYMAVRGGTPGPTDNARVKLLASPTPLDQLLKFKVHHHWSIGSTGTVRVYLNNVLVGSDTGPNNWSGYQTTIYQKAGIYRSASGITRDSQMLYDYVRWYTSDPGDL
jgi:hypothetical protein